MLAVMWVIAALLSAETFQKGMVFGLFARDDPGHAEKGLEELKKLGVD